MAVVLVFTIGLVWGLGAVGKALGRGGDPEKLLQERLVKGEIDEAEYARKLSILRYGPPLELE